MYLTPEKELYTIIQLFYSGNFNDIISLNLINEFDFSNILYDFEANFYKIRSFIILNQNNDALELLNILQNRISIAKENNQIDELSFNTLILDIKVIISYLNNQLDNDLLNLIDNDKPSLALIYKNKYLKNIPISIKNPDLDLESYILLLFTNYPNNIDQYINKLIDLKSHYSDSLILEFAFAWLGLLSNFNDNINLKNSYYFFDELNSSSITNSLKIKINLFACHLKLINIPESLEILKSIENEEENSNPSYDYSLLINKISLASITSNSIERSKLIDEISSKFPNSPYVSDLNSKSQLFDSIVKEYA